MKSFLIPFASLGLLIVTSCGPSAAEKAKQQKIHDDSLVNAAVSATQEKQEQEKQILEQEKQANITAQVNDLQIKLSGLEGELNALTNEPTYVYNKTRLEKVRSGLSTGGSYGWIDQNGNFWKGKDANKQFDAAAAQEQTQLKKIASKKEEIKSVRNKITELLRQ